MIATDLIRAALRSPLLLWSYRCSVTWLSVLVQARRDLWRRRPRQRHRPVLQRRPRFGLLASGWWPASNQPAGRRHLAAYLPGTASTIGPPLAAPLLLPSIGSQWALIVNSLSFVVSFVAVLAIREGAVGVDDVDASTASRNFRREFAEGARFFAGNRVLRALMICVVVATLGIGAINALDVFFVTDNLHAPAAALGTLGVALGVGSVVGAVIATAVGSRVSSFTMFWIMLTALGVAVVAYARATNLGVAIAILFLAGVPLGVLSDRSLDRSCSRPRPSGCSGVLWRCSTRSSRSPRSPAWRWSPTWPARRCAVWMPPLVGCILAASTASSSSLGYSFCGSGLWGRVRAARYGRSCTGGRTAGS